MNRTATNVVLFAALVTALGLEWTFRTDVTQPNVEFLPDMARAVSAEAYSASAVLAGGRTLQAPPDGTIARGLLPLPFAATPEDAIRAGDTLVNPLPADDAQGRRRGAEVFATFCRSCHGDGGTGDGPVTRRGFPPPPSLLADRARQIKDGQIFHIITYGQANMAPLAAHLTREDRWAAVLHVRSLQGAAQTSAVPGGVP
jgi:mono/diheme cytochrome c family protein